MKAGEGEVGDYGGPNRIGEVGDGLDNHHVPSKAAVIESMERDLGRELNPTERANAINESTSVTVDKSVHLEQPTTGGRNTADLVGKDASDLRSAANRDCDALAKSWSQRGVPASQIQSTINEIHNMNQRLGRY